MGTYRRILHILLAVVLLFSPVICFAAGAAVTESEGQVSITFREKDTVKPPPGGGGSGSGSGGDSSGTNRKDPEFQPDTVTILDPAVGPVPQGDLPKTGGDSRIARPELP